MYYGKKKMIITILIIVLLLVALAVGGAVVYLQTDLFKSEETLFIKYMGKQLETMSMNTTTQLDSIISASQQEVYETTGTVTLNATDENGETVNDQLENSAINFTSRVDSVNDKTHTNLKLKYGESDLLDIYYATDGDIYALKWEEIVSTYFVGIRNDNLKVLAQKLGISDTQNIPDKINTSDFEELLNISQEDKDYINQTYTNVFLDNVSSDKYSKQNDMTISKNNQTYVTTAYRLDLTQQDVNNVVVKILETLKQDSRTLNIINSKAKMLELGEEYTTVSGLTNMIQEFIDKINSETIDTTKGLSIVLYAYNGETVLTDIIFQNEKKITIDVNSDNTVTILTITDLSGEETYNVITVTLTKQVADTSTNVNLQINVDDTPTTTVNLSITGLPANGTVQSQLSIINTDEYEETVEINYQASTTYGSLTEEIPDLDNTNCVILNDYPTENLNSLISAIAQRVVLVIREKAMMILF